jgi:hypothetical protein
MKCPNCGNELEDGKLLCENCGEEIKIVPDFDIELEDKLRESISSMMEDMANGDIISDESFDDDIKDEISDYFPSKNITLDKIKGPIIALVVIIVIAVIALTAVNRVNDYRYNSFDYQYGKAVESAANNNYTEAVGYLERAVAIDPDNLDARFLLAKYYDKDGESQSTVSILEEILELNNDYDNREEVYDMLLGIYEDKADYAKMGSLLKNCDIPRILTKYNKYTALEPVFNKEGGVYDELISITISGNSDGFVYYTLDGTIPTKNSLVYETPILLESGEYIVRAMFVNMYGIQSDIVSQNYYISLATPEAPLIEPDSGVYDKPVMIEAYYDNKSKIYYTTDGSTPTKKSNRYVGPIEMPYGISNFSFVTIDDSGLSSSVVSRTFHLEIDANFSTDLAITVLKNNLWAQGKLANVEGNVPNKLGLNQYEVKTLYSLDDRTYYIVYEEYVDTMGKVHDTSNIYAIDVETADLYTAYKLDEGKYNLRPFE